MRIGEREREERSIKRAQPTTSITSVLFEKLITRCFNGDLLFHHQNVPLSRCFELELHGDWPVKY